jgi:predicted nucleic acid-binding protein
MQVVIDTNIIVAAFLTPHGNTAVFMDKVFGGCYDVIVTETILKEYDNVLHRNQFHFEETTQCETLPCRRDAHHVMGAFIKDNGH